MSKARVRHVTKRGQSRLRRQRKPLLFAGGALALALTSALSVASFTGVDVAGAAAAKAQSFLELMRQRSPGERTEAHLTKIKRKHYRVLAERPLPELPPIPALAAYAPPVSLFAPPLQAAIPSFPETPLLAQALPPPAFYTPPVGGIFAPPPGVGPGGPGGPPDQPPPPPGVPEPTSWAMLIAGFGLSGWMLRRRRGGDRRQTDV